MTTGTLRAAFVAVCCAALVAFAGPAMAKGVSRDGFAFPSEGSFKIVVFRPDVHVGSLRVGGLDEPNADWTAAARANIQKAMEATAEARRSQMTFLGDYDGTDGDLLNKYRGLFEVVAASVFSHHMLGDLLPTKQVKRTDPKAPKVYKLDWTLGEEAAKLKAVTGGDYALFFFTRDSYGDAGRKVAQLLMAGLFGSYIPAGVHIGYAGLVDLNTGNVVWFNSDLEMGGDVREADGAVKRVGQLLSGFPLRGSSMVAPAPASAPAPATTPSPASAPATP